MTKQRFLYFVTGMGAGVGAALLWAPKSGSETRAALKTSAAEGQEYVKRQAGQLKHTVNDTLRRGRQAARAAAEGVANALGDETVTA